MFYAGIGSRETPQSILLDMHHIAQQLGTMNWVLRSGAADGADTAFEQGCDLVHGPKEIYIPWSGFQGLKPNRENTIMVGANEYTEEIAARFHPNWSACSRGAKALHARNVCQVLGLNRETPANCIICWTKNASGAGGTGQALRIAKHYNIPIFDLGSDAAYDKLELFVKSRS